MIVDRGGIELLVDPLIDPHGHDPVHIAWPRPKGEAIQSLNGSRALLVGRARCGFAGSPGGNQQQGGGRNKGEAPKRDHAKTTPHHLFNPTCLESCRRKLRAAKAQYSAEMAKLVFGEARARLEMYTFSLIDDIP